MKALEKLSFSKKAQILLPFVFYIVFILFMFHQILQAKTILIKTTLLLLSIVILGVALYSEYLKFLYRKAIKTITIDLDPERAKHEFDDLLKKDVFHAYKNDKKIFYTLYYMDQMQYRECLDSIKENYKFFHSSPDQLLIYHYTNFYCSFMLKDISTAQSEYKKLERMKNTKVKGAKVSPLYNWEFMEAIYLVSRKEYKQAFNVFKNVNTSNMNNREIVQYYYQFAQLCFKMKEKNLQMHYIEEIRKLEGESHTCLKGATI